MAGGAGERFWPLSRKLRPKQLLKLASPDKALLEQTFERLSPLVGEENVFLATAPHLVEPSGQVVPAFRGDQVLAEPWKRNTAGCLVWVAANLLARDPSARETISMAVLAADHRISPDEGNRRTIDAALTVAERTGGLVTIGIPATRPETGYGYIEIDRTKPSEGDDEVKVWHVGRFREKPSREDAERFIAEGNFLWNSGTFFWTLDGFLTELESADPVLYAAIFDIANKLRSGDVAAAENAFEALPNISIDYALMEKARQVYVAEAIFDWDDVGSWDALDRSLEPDESGNIRQGTTVVLDSKGSIIVNDSDKAVVCALGVENLAIVVTEDAVLVIPKERSQEVKKLVEALNAAGIDRV